MGNPRKPHTMLAEIENLRKRIVELENRKPTMNETCAWLVNAAGAMLTAAEVMTQEPESDDSARNSDSTDGQTIHD